MNDTKAYFKSLFNALKIIHSFKIIHRDIKPGNFLYNFKERKGTLIDFGLSEVNKLFPHFFYSFFFLFHSFPFFPFSIFSILYLFFTFFSPLLFFSLFSPPFLFFLFLFSISSLSFFFFLEHNLLIYEFTIFESNLTFLNIASEASAQTHSSKPFE